MHKIIGLLVLTVLISACEKVIDTTNLKYTNRLVVNALIDNVNSPKVSVSQTIPISNTDSFPPVATAKVELKGSFGTVVMVYNLFSKVYETTQVLNAGQTYTIVVSAPGFATANSSLVMPAAINLSGAKFVDSVGLDKDGFKIGAVEFPIADAANIKNYYKVELFTWNTALSQWDEASVDFFDADLAAASEKNQEGIVVLSDNYFDGKTRVVRLVAPFGFAFQSPKFRVRVSSLEYSYYAYLQSIDNIDQTQIVGVFEEAQRVYTNIVNGVGIFAGSTISEGIIN